MKYIYLSLVVTSFIYAEEIKNLPSYQGFRGAINTPNAKVIKEGEFEYLYTDQVEPFSHGLNIASRDNRIQENYYLNMGILPNLEINSQYAYGYDEKKHQKDISNRIINAKYQIPFIPKNLFQMAVGIQDAGGGNPYIGNKYAVVSKEFNNLNLRANVGYAKGDIEASVDGIFGSVEYQPLSWLQLVGEYDTREWNGAIKTALPVKLGKKTINLGLMAKTSSDYNDIYYGFYANMPFVDENRLNKKKIDSLSKYSRDIDSLKLSNIVSYTKDNTLYFEYENTLYTYSDIDALGMVLGILSSTSKAKTINVSIKKANIVQYSIEIDNQEYKKFLKTGEYIPALLRFTSYTQHNHTQKYSDRFKPTISVEPSFVLIDGGEMGDVFDYTVALQAEASMRLAKGTILSARYNIPLSISQNFEEGFVFDYRNRHKTTAQIDQALLTQYLTFDTTYPWTTVGQIGLFDKELKGISIESSVSDRSGKHQVVLKVAQLEDTLSMDKYTEEKREERLISYRYYSDKINSNIALTAGEYLYGDKGETLSFERYFSDIALKFDLSHTTHSRKGTNNLAKLTLSIPLGINKRIKTDYMDFKTGELTYEKRKAIVNSGIAYALPHHLKKVDNSFTLEKYYLNNNRFHPAYIKANYNRLRNVFIGE